MLRTALLSLILIVSLSSSASMIRKSVFRRQLDTKYCHAIEGFECKCLNDNITCTTDRDLPNPINILPNEKNKYQSVELLVAAASDIYVTDQTFAPVKELYKPDADNLEFRIKFEKFTALHLSSPGIFNQVFPDNIPANAKKHLALEIYNTEVPPNDNQYLFKNLNADSVELYALYPFKGSFQQLFEGANIKYLRLSGGDIRSDVSQPFTGNINRLELVKQASSLSVQNFPVYPAHELTINAFYVNDFNDEHPPNYNNLVELRVHSNGPILANAFRNFPNIKTLQVSTEQGIDPQAFNGLNNLEKLIIKDTRLPVDALKNFPNLKEYETNIEKLDEISQCQLIEKLGNGQLAVRTISEDQPCTCVLAYLESAAGRSPCNAQHCDHSSCAAIKNNYDVETRTFMAPPAILRADGSNALRQREPQGYSGPYQVPSQDQQKLQQGTPQQIQQPSGDGSQGPADGDQGSWQPNQPYNPDTNGDTDGQHTDDSQHQESLDRPDRSFSEDNQGEQPDNPPYFNEDYYVDDDANVQTVTITTTKTTTMTTKSDWNNERDDAITTTAYGIHDDQQSSGGTYGSGESQIGEGGNNERRENEGAGDSSGSDLIGSRGSNSTGTDSPPKKRLSWILIIIVAASIVVLLLVGPLFLFLRKQKQNKRTNSKKVYHEAQTSEKEEASTM